jgi:5'-3' exonuclease
MDEPIVLFDANCLLYIHGFKSNYEESIHNHLRAVMRKCNTTKYIGVLDGKGNFRHSASITKVYKGHRTSDKPPYFYKVRDLLVSKYGFVFANGVEADDVVAILATRINALNNELNGLDIKPIPRTIIASIDKDLLQVNSFHYNLKSHDLVLVSDETSELDLTSKKKLKGSGYKLLYAQMLMGDSADNIPGLPKYGPVKAYNLINDCVDRDECKKVVMEEYEKVHGENAIKNLQETFSLVYILRNSNSLGYFPIKKFSDEPITFQPLEL